MFITPQPNVELAALIEQVRGYKMTAQERREQRVSFVYGMLPHRSTQTKDDVRKFLDEWEGVA
jgi:hypothetical protein